MGLLHLPLEILQNIILHVDALRIPQLRLVRTYIDLPRTMN